MMLHSLPRARAIALFLDLLHLCGRRRTELSLTPSPRARTDVPGRVRAESRSGHGESTPETKALVEQWKAEVWEGHSEGVEEHLRELAAAGQEDRDQTLRKCADYLRTHQARLRYHLFRAAGWPVGSGVVEGACKHVVGLRFKRQSPSADGLDQGWRPRRAASPSGPAQRPLGASQKAYLPSTAPGCLNPDQR
jgi:predicted NBD/HSP70 family sugar kinase